MFWKDLAGYSFQDWGGGGGGRIAGGGGGGEKKDSLDKYLQTFKHSIFQC